MDVKILVLKLKLTSVLHPRQPWYLSTQTDVHTCIHIEREATYVPTYKPTQSVLALHVARDREKKGLTCWPALGIFARHLYWYFLLWSNKSIVTMSSGLIYCLWTFTSWDSERKGPVWWGITVHLIINSRHNRAKLESMSSSVASIKWPTFYFSLLDLHLTFVWIYAR